MLKGQKAELGGSTPYQKWIASQGIPILKEFYVKDLGTVELEPWEWKGGLGAYLNLIGTGESNDSYICEIPPGKSLHPQRYLFEEMIYVVSGHGATSVWNEDGKKSTFEWGAGSVFSPPLNTWRQHFNGSGSEPARFFAVTSAPLVINLFHNPDFVFDNHFTFDDRFSSPEDYFSGKGEQYDFRAIKVWDTNFIADVRSIELYVRENRGAGGRFLGIELSENSMTAHIAEFPVGTYKKAHRHGPGAHVVILGGKGFSLMWPGGSDIQKFDWHERSVIVPPEMWFHQHFNSGGTPARYLALRWNSRKFPMREKGFGTDKSVKEGGDQIEYEDEDPRIREIFESELAREGLQSRMAAVTG